MCVHTCVCVGGVCLFVCTCVSSNVTSPLSSPTPLLHVLVRVASLLLEHVVDFLTHQSLSPKQSQLTVMDQPARTMSM